jgi:hypothetical protein
MKKSLWAGVAGLSCLTVLAASAPSRGMMIAPASIPQRVAQAQIVVIGKVMKFADKTVKAPQFPGADEKVDWQIAQVKVGDALLGGDKDMKEIKVGFVPPPPPGAGGPGRPGGPGGPIDIGPRRFGVSLQVEQEYILFLSPKANGDFYAVQNFADFIGKKDNQNFDKDLAEVKRCVKLLADPRSGLTGKEADDRFLTAAMLLVRYKMPRLGQDNAKTEKIDAEESKQILLALADADWNAQPKGPGLQLNPLMAFQQLGLTEKDGFTPPKDFNEFPKLAKKWLKDNADKYRVERFVMDAKEEKKDK